MQDPRFLEAKEHLLAHQIDDADPHVVHALAVDLDRAVAAARGMWRRGGPAQRAS